MIVMVPIIVTVVGIVIETSTEHSRKESSANDGSVSINISDDDGNNTRYIMILMMIVMMLVMMVVMMVFMMVMMIVM